MRSVINIHCIYISLFVRNSKKERHEEGRKGNEYRDSETNDTSTHSTQTMRKPYSKLLKSEEIQLVILVYFMGKNSV